MSGKQSLNVGNGGTGKKKKFHQCLMLAEHTKSACMLWTETQQVPSLSTPKNGTGIADEASV